MHAPREIMYLERRLERGDLVQEKQVRELRRHVHARVVEQAARPHETRPRQLGQRAESSREPFRARLDVAAERHHGEGLPRGTM